MESSILQEEKIIKDARNLFRFEKQNKVIKDRILRDIRNLFKHEEKEKNYYKPVRISTFSSNNDLEYETKPYVKDIIHNFEKSDTWKIKLTIAINLISSIAAFKCRKCI